MSYLKVIVKQLLKVLCIIPVSKRKVFFLSFDGTEFAYDSKAVVEYLEDKYPNKYKLIWGVNNFDHFCSISYPDLEFVKIKSLKGFFAMMTAGTLFYNVNPPSYIPFRRKQKLINCWHSISYKKVGKYIQGFDPEQINLTTHYLSHAEKFTDWVLIDSFEYKNQVIESGVPRNDVFFSNKQEIIKDRIKQQYDIHSEKKIILFAPTFRNDFNYYDAGIDFKRLKEALSLKFGSEWVVMYRLHPMIAKKYNISFDGLIDVSLHPDMQELLCAADVFMSDYSGGMWDFSLTGRPVIVYADDIDEYNKRRGLYMDISKLPFMIARTNDELERIIRDYNEKQYKVKLDEYFKYMNSYETGHACEEVVRLIEQ